MKRDDIIRMAREAGFGLSHDGTWLCAINHIERFANLVAAAERESCAKYFDDSDYMMYRSEVARAIRASGQA